MFRRLAITTLASIMAMAAFAQFASAAHAWTAELDIHSKYDGNYVYTSCPQPGCPSPWEYQVTAVEEDANDVTIRIVDMGKHDIPNCTNIDISLTGVASGNRVKFIIDRDLQTSTGTLYECPNEGWPSLGALGNDTQHVIVTDSSTSNPGSATYLYAPN